MIALVLVAHSPDVARGLAAMVRQSAAQVPVLLAAGTATGTLGTAAPAVEAAIRSALDLAPAGVVVLLDMNSAALAVEMALEELDTERRARVRVSRGPLIEGALAAAVSASGEASLAEVLRASEAPPAKLPDDWPADGRAPGSARPAP